MISREIKAKKRGGGTFRIVGQDAGAWIIERLDTFASPERVSPAELQTRFGVVRDDAPEVDEAKGWEALAAANADGALTLAQRDFEQKPTPEEHFVRVSAEAAARLGHQ